MKNAKTPDFGLVIAAFDGDPHVAHNEGKGFGSKSLKVKGKIFAMISSKGDFVVKLPKPRVEELVAAENGKRFDPGHGRIMKEWIAVTQADANWIALSREARDFVARV